MRRKPRRLSQEIEERAKTLLFLEMRGGVGVDLRLDEGQHVLAQFRQQPVEQILAVGKMGIERALRHAGARREMRATDASA